MGAPYIYDISRLRVKIAIILQHTSSYMLRDSTSPSAGNIQLYKTAA